VTRAGGGPTADRARHAGCRVAPGVGTLGAWYGSPVLPSPGVADDVAEFMESGVSILVGSRDASLRPACLRAMGVHVDRSSGIATVYLPRAIAERTVKNLRDNGQVAVTFSRAIDHRSVQLKGTCVEIRDSGDQDRAIQEKYRRAWFDQLGTIGMAPRVLERAAWWPSVAVSFRVRETFEQTPGPLAGSRLS